jgi:hypothetical protein
VFYKQRDSLRESNSIHPYCSLHYLLAVRTRPCASHIDVHEPSTVHFILFSTLFQCFQKSIKFWKVNAWTSGGKFLKKFQKGPNESILFITVELSKYVVWHNLCHFVHSAKLEKSDYFSGVCRIGKMRQNKQINYYYTSSKNDL